MRRNLFRTLAVGVVAVLAFGTVFAAPAGDGLTLPVGFEHWYLVNSMVVTKDSPLFEAIGGLHHIYINAVDGVYGVPETFFIDRSGIIKFKEAGPVDLEILEKNLPLIL